MVLEYFEDKKTIEAENLHDLCVFRFNGIVLVFSKNEQFIISCEDINEFVIKIKGGYYFYTTDNNTINIVFNHRYDEFFIYNTIIEDIHLSQILFLKTGNYWKIYNTKTESFISQKEFSISNNKINSLKKDNLLYELHIRDKCDNDVILDLLSAEILY